MTIWTNEANELDKIYDSSKGQHPDIDKELEQLIKTGDPNVVMLYSRRCLEVIVSDLCETELKRPRKTEPLKGIIDKLNKEEKIPSHIIASMLGVNSLSNYGAHPKEFDPEQVKPVLNNLAIVTKWYLKFKDPVPVVKSKKESHASEQLDISNVEKSIAILPFKNDSPDEENTYFINGIMEELLTNLQKIREFRVLSRTSVEQYRHQSKSIPEIAKELGVSYIVEGSAQKYANMFRMRVQLIMAAKENHLWAKSYQQEILDVTDIFSIQNQIAEAIAEELNAAITPREKELIEKVPTTDMEAYETYVLGRNYLSNFTPHDLENALKYFKLAVEKDEGFALAYIGISDSWYGLYQLGVYPPSDPAPLKEIYTALNKALALDNSLAEVHLSLGNLKASVEWDWDACMKEYDIALSINPNYANVYAAYSNSLMALGRVDESIDMINKAVNLDPNNIFTQDLYGATMFFARRYDIAITTFQNILKMEPHNFLAMQMLPMSFHMTGNYKDELKSWKSYMNTHYENSELDLDKIFDAKYTEKDYKRTMNILADNLLEHLESNYFDIFIIALLYAGAGENEKTLKCLERCYELHNPNILFLLNPVFDTIRSEPRYIELCKKMNLPHN